MTNTADRHFIVAKQGERTGSPVVIIREVAPGSCSHTLSRREAWDFAKTLAQPINVKGGRKSPLARMEFVNLDGMTTGLGTAEREAKPAPKPAEAQAPVSKPADTRVAPSQVKDGHYALRDDEGVVKFYKVENGKAGTRWDGYTFVKAQASDELWPIRNRSERERILAAIAIDSMSALTLYGREIGRCGVCNRTLTDEESRAKGIGPICEAAL